MKIPVNGTAGSRRPGTWRLASKDSIYPTRYVNGKKDGRGGRVVRTWDPQPLRAIVMDMAPSNS
jgi:hypothetical protein